MSELEDFRAEKDAFFRDDPRSPATPGQRNGFGRLAYFREEPGLAILAKLEAQGVDRDETIEMQTTTGGVQVYRRAGIARFEVDGEPAAVTLYASEDMDELFLPFRDATSGRETYGAGRYLEVEPPGADGRVLVDFNAAYNPYCAYNRTGPVRSLPMRTGSRYPPAPERRRSKAEAIQPADVDKGARREAPVLALDGTETVNVLPLPGVLATSTRPRSSSTSSFARCRPSPRPPCDRVALWSI
jgi:uncharacterized protein